MRARTQQALRIVAGITLASAVFGASVSSFTPDGAATGIFTGAVIGFVLSTLGMLMLGPWSRALQTWPLGVVFLLRTLIYGIVFMLVPNAVSALVHGSLAPFRDPTRVVTGTTLALSFAFAFCLNFVLTISRLLGNISSRGLEAKARWECLYRLATGGRSRPNLRRIEQTTTRRPMLGSNPSNGGGGLTMNGMVATCIR